MGEGLTKEDVLRIVEERQIKFVRFWFTDVLGFLKSFAVTPAELEACLDSGQFQVLAWAAAAALALRHIS